MAFGENTFRFLVATDNHLGFNEKDPVRGNDSFTAFEEILQLAREHEVDALLLGGDLFHDNKPSRKCLHSCMELLRHYCLGSRPSDLELLSDPSVNFPGRFGSANYEDPNFNVALPVFSIHGNHDDPTGEGNLSSLDLLSTAGLINYFGKCREVDDINMMPILLRKGTSNFALYGLGNIRDERLHRTFLSRKVKMLTPPGDASSWFNLLLFHQNRVAHGATNFIPETFLDESLDLIIWGHEHDNQIEPLHVPQRDFYISQPGSSVATSLSEGEASRPKAVALLEVTGKSFELTPIVLKSVRPFIFGDVSLAAPGNQLNPSDAKAIEKFILTQIDELIARANQEWLHRQGPESEAQQLPPPLPIIRLKVDYSGGFVSFNPHRFGHLLLGKVANPKDVLFFYRKRSSQSSGGAASSRSPTSLPLISQSLEENGDRGTAIKMEDLVAGYLANQNLHLFPQNEFGDIVRIFVEKDDKDSIEGFVKQALNRVCSTLQQAGSVTSYDESTLKGAIGRERIQREIEWRRLHPGLDAVSSHKATKHVAEAISHNEDENEDFSLNSNGFTEAEEALKSKLPAKRATTRGGRGRGRASALAMATSTASSEASSINPSTGRWPPRT